MRPFRASAALLMIAASFPVSQVSAESNEPLTVDQVIALHLSGVSAAKKVYDRLEGEIETRNMIGGGDWEAAPGVRVRFTRHDSWMRMERISVGKEIVGMTPRLALGRNSQYNFGLEAKTRTGAYSVFRCEREFEMGCPLDLDLNSRLYAPFASNGVFYSRIFPNFPEGTAKTQHVVRDGKEMVELSFELTPSQKTVNVKSGRVWFDPAYHWLAVAAEIHAANRKRTIVMKTSVRFAPEPIEGMPVPLEVIQDMSSIGDVLVSRFSKLRICTEPEKSFMLTHFGLPEPAAYTLGNPLNKKIAPFAILTIDDMNKMVSQAKLRAARQASKN